jgi:arylsulfatase A-like enzyme
VRAIHFAAGAVCVALAACRSSDRNRESGPPPAASPKPPAPASAAPKEIPPPAPPGPLNVLLITIDSLRADMPWTGYPRAIAPNLTRLAEQSVVYPNAYSVSSYTAKSVAALLSGRYPSTLYRTGWFFAGYAKSNRFFTELLQEKGIRTLAWHSHLYFGRGKGLEQGFDEWHVVPGITFDAQTDPNVTSPKMTALGIELLGKPENSGKRFFAWAHYMDPHDEYVKHKESPDFGNKNRDRYDSEVFYTDLWLQKLLDFCRQQPWWKDTALIVSADHGEAFGEHGMYKHAFELWEVLTRIPLIVHAPGAAPRRIEQRRSVIDLTPTILELLGVERPDDLVGRSLVDEIYGAKPPDVREPIVSELAEDSHNPQVRAIVNGDYKLIVYGDPPLSYLLFNLKDDPGETKNLVKEQPEQLATMKELYRTTYANIPTIKPYGGMKLKSGKTANGPTGPTP